MCTPAFSPRLGTSWQSHQVPRKHLLKEFEFRRQSHWKKKNGSEQVFLFRGETWHHSLRFWNQRLPNSSLLWTPGLAESPRTRPGTLPTPVMAISADGLRNTWGLWGEERSSVSRYQHRFLIFFYFKPPHNSNISLIIFCREIKLITRCNIKY